MSETARLSLPFILPGQAQKELFHNEALQLLDLMVQAVVEGGPMNQPPAAPVPGRTHLVGPSPTGEWAEHPNAIAGWTESGWRFAGAFEGMEVASRSGYKFRFADGVWENAKVIAKELVVDGQKVVGARSGPIAEPTSGAVIDQQARTAILHILAAMRQHGLIAPA